MFSECRHIRPSGLKCHSPAMREMPYCYYHTSLHQLAKSRSRHADEPLEIPMPEDAGSLQIGVMQVISGLCSSKLDPRRAGLILYAFQIAAQFIPRPSSEEAPKTVRSVSVDEDGDALAPEKSVCEPPIDCPECPAKSSCLNMVRINYRSAARYLSSIRKDQDSWDEKDRKTAASEGSSGA